MDLIGLSEIKKGYIVIAIDLFQKCQRQKRSELECNCAEQKGEDNQPLPCNMPIPYTHRHTSNGQSPHNTKFIGPHRHMRMRAIWDVLNTAFTYPECDRPCDQINPGLFSNYCQKAAYEKLSIPCLALRGTKPRAITK